MSFLSVFQSNGPKQVQSHTFGSMKTLLNFVFATISHTGSSKSRCSVEDRQLHEDDVRVRQAGLPRNITRWSVDMSLSPPGGLCFRQQAAVFDWSWS